MEEKLLELAYVGAGAVTLEVESPDCDLSELTLLGKQCGQAVVIEGDSYAADSFIGGAVPRPAPAVHKLEPVRPYGLDIELGAEDFPLLQGESEVCTAVSVGEWRPGFPRRLLRNLSNPCCGAALGTLLDGLGVTYGALGTHLAAVGVLLSL